MANSSGGDESSAAERQAFSDKLESIASGSDLREQGRAEREAESMGMKFGLPSQRIGASAPASFL